MNNTKRSLAWLEEHFEEFLVIALLWVVIAIVVIEVFRRYVLQASGEYSEEIARFTLIWLVYLGVPYAIKRRRHISCEMLPARLPPLVHHSVNIFADVMFLAFAVLMVWHGWEVMQMHVMIDKRTDAMRLPAIVISSAPVLGCLLAWFRLVQNIVREAQDIRREFVRQTDVDVLYFDEDRKV
jgi:TRAP-type C4-dicarboxylate transport system permease small subunit